MIEYEVYITHRGEITYLHKPSLNEHMAIQNGILVKEVNAAGSFTFDIACGHPNYDDYFLHKEIIVKKNGKALFTGRIDGIDVAWDKTITITANGALSLLNDLIVPPYSYNYNKSIGQDQQAFFPNDDQGMHNIFTNTFVNRKDLGSTKAGWVKNGEGWASYIWDFFRVASRNIREITFVDDSIGGGYPERLKKIADKSNQRASSSYPCLLDEFMEKVIKYEGGFIICEPRVINSASGEAIMQLDYTDAPYPGKECAQTIEFGKNLLDLSRYADMSNMVTLVLPLGAKIDGSTRDGDAARLAMSFSEILHPYAYNSHFVRKQSGDVHIEKVVVFDAVTTQEELYQHALAYLEKRELETVAFAISAFDLSMIDVNYDEIEVGDMVRVKSEPHGIDLRVMCRRITYDLMNPENTTYEFGQDTSRKASEIIAKR